MNSSLGTCGATPAEAGSPLAIVALPPEKFLPKKSLLKMNLPQQMPWQLCAKYLALVLVAMLANAPAVGAEFTLSDFNGSGFSYTFGDFVQTTGPTSIRLSDPINDSGGAGLNQTLDLSSHADSRFVVDMFTNPGNQAGVFHLELIDTMDRRGKWSFGVNNLDPGVTTPLVSATTLANPTSGINDFRNLDLSNITTWQVVGPYSSDAAFDLSFDRVAVSDTVVAPPAYPGAEPDAPWRATAAARIDANRKAALQVNVTDFGGNPIPGANVSVQMTEHEFGFGSAVQAWRLRSSSSQHAMYKEKTAELFNIATIENNLKWPPWDGEWGGNYTQAGAQTALNWLSNESIDVRGHTLVWPGYSNLPTPVKSILDQAPLNATQQQQLRDAVAAHITDIGGTLAGQLVAWDVVNEPRDNHDIMDNLPEGNAAMSAWFNAIAAIDPNAKRYINNYGILDSAGGTNTFNQQEYYDTAEFLINDGAAIQGIGFQSHFTEDDLTGPEQIWTILDRFADLGLDMQITEFDFTTTNEQLQAQFTRDFMTAVFAHEGVDDFVSWGFWEDAHWRPDAAMYRSDWSIKPNGQAYLDLVFDEWWTSEDLATALAGEASLDGFNGEYEITVTVGGIERVLTATLGDDGLVLDVVLPILPADFDTDGDVDADDLAAWQAGFASGTTRAAGDADGNGIVDGGDFLQWQRQFGIVTTSSALATVPEPSTLVLAAGLSSLLLSRRRRR